MKILFCRSRTLVSWLIRILTWSDWSHVVLLDPDGVRTVEARWPRVIESTLGAVMADNSIVRTVELPCMDPKAAMRWARAQVGRPYDWKALLGFLTHRDWTDPDRWFCSELVVAAFLEGGTHLVRLEAMERVTPQHLWMLPGL